MSLKEFHVVFITAAVLLSLGFAAWAFVRYSQFHGGLYAGTAVLSLIAAVALTVYEVYFIKKAKAYDDP